MQNRSFKYELLPEIMNHWSPRAYDPERAVADDDVRAMLDAARHAPSCMNEQPWQYIVAGSETDRQKLIEVLGQGNQEWAFRAPLLMLILSRKHFAGNGRENRWHLFDAGTSWGYLQLEAQRRGLITHAMGGFDVDKAREAFAIPDEYSVIAALAIGYYGNPDDLSPKNKEREHPHPRKLIEEMFFNAQDIQKG